MKSTKIMPPTYLLIAIIAMLAFHFIFPVAWIVPSLWNLIGLVFLVSGVIMNLIADKTFHQAGTTVKPFEESEMLVTDGVFKISRNPMYLGFVLILAGVAIFLRSLSPILVIFAFVALITNSFIKAEERMLAEKFGSSWEQYKLKTRRWF
ncbi:MAG: isoprenylcysteine carboxylmethyltransferase family protein [Anaerolineales bacterium]|nr:isoprenylcysteine carboxylmethyltransferase family protein [Anaerolineales bacterium]